MNVVVSIKNATPMTPVLSVVQVTNADWLHTQELVAGQSIAGNVTVAGMLEATLPFSGKIVVHYSYVAPGPEGADVVFTLDGTSLDGQPLVGCGYTVSRDKILTNTSVEVHREGNDYYLMLAIA